MYMLLISCFSRIWRTDTFPLPAFGTSSPNQVIAFIAPLSSQLDETESVNGKPRQSVAKGLALLWEPKSKLSHWS